jgi:hypothetical protein
MSITREQVIEALLEMPPLDLLKILRQYKMNADWLPVPMSEHMRYIFPVIRTLVCNPDGSGTGGPWMPDFDVTGIHLGVEPSYAFRKKDPDE